MFAKTMEEAKAYAVANTPKGGMVKESTLECACGESAGVVIYDKDGYGVEEVVVCEACYYDAAIFDRV